MDFKKFDQMVDIEGLKKDIESASSNTYEEVPHGEYEVEVEKIELRESKKGDPMVSIWFRIINGDYEGQLLFMNQVIVKGFQIHIVNELLRSLGSGLDIEFQSYEQYGNLLMDVAEAVEDMEYALDYGENRGFNTFKIDEIFEDEDE